MVEGPVTGRKIKRSTIRKLMIAGVGLVFLLVIVFGGLFTFQNISEIAEQKTEGALQDISKQAADKIRDPIEQARKQLDVLASDEAMVALFSEADSVVLESEGEKRKSAFKSALKLRLFLPDGYKTDREVMPPISFASVDLLNRAESSVSAMAAEVHSLGSEGAHIAIARRVTDVDNNLVGLLHLSLPLTVIESITAKLGIPEVYIEIQQGSGAKALTLTKFGDAKLRKGKSAVVRIKGTKWNAVSWNKESADSVVADDSGGQEESGMGMYLIILLVLAAGAGGFVFYRRKQSGAGPKDKAGQKVVYEGAVKAIMEGEHPGLEKLVPDLPQSGKKVSNAAISSGLQGDDITAMATPTGVPEQAPGPGAAAADAPAPIPGQPAPEAESVTDDIPAPGPEQQAAPESPPVETVGSTVADAAEPVDVSPDIFRTYDIRGVVGETLSAPVVREIGRAIGSEAYDRGQQGVVVARDGRISSPELGDALIEGLRASGRDVIDIGVVPTPVLYFATHHLETNSGVMVTGSHNAPEYNGLKIVLAGETLSGEAITAIRNRITNNEISEGQGSLQVADISADYIRRITDDIPVALGGAFKIIVDCGNGVAGNLAPQLYRAMGHDVVELYCEIDGNFPNHHPDPSQPENLQALIDAVKEEGADLGFAFDGDGDRLGIVDGEGNIIWPDRQMMLFARDVLSRNQGAPIIFDVKCSRYLKAIIEASGGKPLMWKTGHSLIKAKMKEVDAPLAGELSGHIFFKERWFGFDDGLYAGARALEILANSKNNPTETFAVLPDGISTPELRIPLAEKHHAKAMEIMKKKIKVEDAEVNDIDGLRVDFSDGWGLVRPSNTSPFLVARFEAESKEALERIQAEFRDLLLSVSADLKLPF